LGHAGSYAHIYWGIESPAWAIEEWEAYVTYSLLRWIYWGLAQIVPSTDLVAPLLLNAIARGLGVLGVGVFAALWSRREVVGVAAAALLVLDPVHGFWGASIFNLAIPYAFAVLCLVQTLAAWRGGSSLLLAAAAASGALMVAGRVEWGLLAPALLLLLASLGTDWGRHPATRSPRYWAAALTVLAALGGTLYLGGGDLTSQGGFHGVRGYLETIGRQGAIRAWYPAAGTIPGIVGIALGLGLAVRSGRLGWFAGLAPLAAFGLMHLGLSTFNDYGYRNALVPGLLLLAPLGMAAVVALDVQEKAGLRVLAGVALAASAVLSAAALHDWTVRYYMTGDAFEAGCCTDDRARIETEWLSSGVCYMITDDETLWDAGVAGSHFNLMEPDEAARHWDDHDGCIVWLLDGFSARVDELSVQDRALKLRRWYRWERRGWTRLPDGSAAEVHRMTERPPGASRPPAGWRPHDDESRLGR
jgi:hypothetical protein